MPPYYTSLGDGRSHCDHSVHVAPISMKVGNPAVDVTLHKYVAVIVTENGIAYPPSEFSLRKVVNGL